MLFAGLAYASFEAAAHRSSILPQKYEGSVVRVTGFFCSLPVKRPLYSSAEFCVQKQSSLLPHALTKISVRWTQEYSLSPGLGYIELTLKLKRPRGTVNPYGGSYEKYMFFRRISALATVQARGNSQGQATLIVDESWLNTLRRHITVTRFQLSQRLSKLLEGLEHEGMIGALVLGDRSVISASDDRYLRQTGTQHLMAISGLHVGLLMWLLFRFLPKSIFGIVMLASVSLIYIVLVGFGASAQRAWIMGMLAVIATSGIKRTSLSASFLLGALLVLVLDPLAPLSLGFWYSFTAVAALLVLSKLKLMSATFGGLIVVQFVLMLVLLPLNSLFGVTQSGVSGLANLLAIPWVSIFVLPASLLATLVSYIDMAVAVSIFTVVNEVLHILMSLFEVLVAIPSSVKSLNSVYLLLAFSTILVSAVFLSHFRGVVLGFVLVIVLWIVVPARQDKVGHELLVFDAGQGLALALKTDKSVWLYDTGSRFERSSVAERVIIPFLRAQNLPSTIEGLIISHGDLDHAGGVTEVSNAYNPKHIWAGERERLPLGVNADSCHRGMVWQYRDMRIEVLFPTEHYQAKTANNHSCVVMITIKGFRILVMGDLEGEGERDFLRAFKGDLRADVLIAGHHGSKNASSYALLKRVKPEFVVFSAGFRNRFGHPHVSVLERVRRFDVNVYTTAESGAITLVFSDGLLGGYLDVNELRKEDKSFWLSN